MLLNSSNSGKQAWGGSPFAAAAAAAAYTSKKVCKKTNIDLLCALAMSGPTSLGSSSSSSFNLVFETATAMDRTKAESCAFYSIVTSIEMLYAVYYIVLILLPARRTEYRTYYLRLRSAQSF